MACAVESQLAVQYLAPAIHSGAAGSLRSPVAFDTRQLDGVCSKTLVISGLIPAPAALLQRSFQWHADHAWDRLAACSCPLVRSLPDTLARMILHCMLPLLVDILERCTHMGGSCADVQEDNAGRVHEEQHDTSWQGVLQERSDQMTMAHQCSCNKP